MLGYSDSAKEMGALASRVAIAKAMQGIDRLCARKRVVPIFFNGSGGSIDRGGGSIEEQTAWWTPSALRNFKATIQGEMVERTFASPELIRSGLERIAERAEAAQKSRAVSRLTRPVEDFAERASLAYRIQLARPEFLEVFEKATAYRYLSLLRIGSRPTKRSASVAVSSLRAIPWVLSWTQTRVLFPTWWGVGTAWQDSNGADRNKLSRACRRDPLFSSFVKLLGFTLAKVELPVWHLYLKSSGLEAARVESTMAEFHREYSRSVAFVRAMSGKRNLLWFRPWLGESIRLRSPMIHPINLLQIIALEKKDPILIRETVTGIASGMMTTG
jgi:phosphoenolpyruvate carboxylase